MPEAIHALKKIVLATVLAAFLGPSLEAQLFECPRFRRGDANDDGKVDISDAVATLGVLFLGEGEISCEDAADSNDDGAVDISDPISTLTFLWLGGPAPPPPGPFQCGRDATFDPLECFVYKNCSEVVEERDFSGFKVFEYEQSPALGFCPELDRVFAASIRKLDDGGYNLEMSVLRRGKEGVDDCLQSFFHEFGEMVCAVPVKLPPRRLAKDEAAGLLEIFSKVSVYPKPAQFCDCIAIDPCVIREFGWDGSRVSEFECSGPRMDRSQAAKILQFLETLRAE